MKYNTIREYIEKHIQEQAQSEGLGLLSILTARQDK